MSVSTTPAVVDAAEQQPTFTLQRAYVRGMSLEMPLGANTFLQAGNPHLDLSVNVTPTEIQPGVFEVVLRATLTSTLEGKTMFLLELDEAGIFEIRNIPAEHMPAVLEVNCPTILTPYLRAQVADMMTRATLPVFHLPEVNWVVMFEQRQQAARGEAANTAQLH